MGVRWDIEPSGDDSVSGGWKGRCQDTPEIGKVFGGCHASCGYSNSRLFSYLECCVLDKTTFAHFFIYIITKTHCYQCI